MNSRKQRNAGSNKMHININIIIQLGKECVSPLQRESRWLRSQSVPRT